MITLGFVWAGVIGLSNALWVVIGANIGSTLTPWLVTFFGFKLDIESFALPMIGIGGVATIIFGKSEKVMNIAKFLIGFGLLFLGLSYMKESVEVISHAISLDQYSHFSIWWYVLIGAIITTIMQTSTWSTIITLTALNANIITLDMALGIVIGANLGSAISTSIMWILSSTPTQIQKKKVALSHLIFNVTTTIIVTLLYTYIRDLLLWVWWAKASNILILSMFHTTFNIILAVIWTPLLWVLLKVLHYIYPPQQSDIHFAIDHLNTNIAEEVIPALHKDALMLLEKVEAYNRHVLYLDHTPHYPQKTYDDYIKIKEIEEKVLKYIILTHGFAYTQEQSKQIHIVNECIMQAITSSKYLKDIQHHIINLKDESISHPALANSLHTFQALVLKTSDHIHEINHNEDYKNNIYLLEDILKSLHVFNDEYLASITLDWDEKEINSINIAEVIKTNRYVLLSCEAIVKAYIEELKLERK